jgi:rhodanese-related sulfurtransferase/rubrerythrin
MGVQEYFKPLSVWTADQVRRFLKDKHQNEYCLLDVRRPVEYQGGHLPGALLIPLDELPERLGELDHQKPVITYCASGMRSRAAAAFLLNSDFREVHSLEGGIKAWQGRVAQGVPEAGIAYFSPAGGTEELIALAWLLEEGSRKFYNALSASMGDKEAGAIFSGLAAAEEHHKASLFDLYRNYSGKGSDDAFPQSALPGLQAGDVMEGGMAVSEALKWAEGRDISDILELALSLETNAYDLCLKMEKAVNDTASAEVFRTIAGEERIHLDRLTSLFEKRLSA